MSGMILELLPRFTGSATAPDGSSPMTPSTVPAWLRRALSDPQSHAKQGIEDIGIAAGAAIGALDAVVRRREIWAGVWRQRLALTAGAVTARLSGRIEDEKALRDALLLTRPGDDVGPAGRMILGWRRLTTQPAGELLSANSVAVTLEAFGHLRDQGAVDDLAHLLSQLCSSSGMVDMLDGAFVAAEHGGPGQAFGAWLADALLAQRLGWKHAVPLLGTELAASSKKTAIRMDADRRKQLLAAQAKAALRAIDLSADLARRAEKLLVAAPKLRAKAADTIIDRLLNEDALAASGADKQTGMSDRGLRRLFDRLVELGAVRELSGRPTFRIYGL